jgi:hypothetical protein
MPTPAELQDARKVPAGIRDGARKLLGSAGDRSAAKRGPRRSRPAARNALGGDRSETTRLPADDSLCGDADLRAPGLRADCCRAGKAERMAGKKIRDPHHLVTPPDSIPNSIPRRSLRNHKVVIAGVESGPARAWRPFPSRPAQGSGPAIERKTLQVPAEGDMSRPQRLCAVLIRPVLTVHEHRYPAVDLRPDYWPPAAV